MHPPLNSPSQEIQSTKPAVLVLASNKLELTLRETQIQIFQQGKGGSKSPFPIKFSAKPSMHDTARLEKQHAMQLLLQNQS